MHVMQAPNGSTELPTPMLLEPIRGEKADGSMER